MFLTSKRAEAAAPTGSQAAILIIAITIILILYLLFLPPEAREEILSGNGDGSSIYGSGSGSGSTTSGQSSLLLSVSPGYMEYFSGDSIKHTLNPLQISSSKDIKALFTSSRATIKHNWFDEKSASFTFTVSNVDSTDNYLLSFSAKKYSGVLLVYLNDELVQTVLVNKQNPDPIVLPKSLVQPTNTLRFVAEEVGWEFWKSNSFELEDIKVLGEVVDAYDSAIDVYFEVDEKEFDNLDDSVLKFDVDCVTSTVGKLTVLFNNQQVYRQVPLCSAQTVPVIVSDYLVEGENIIEFSTEDGSFIISQLMVETQLKEAINPVYTFEIDEKYFSKVIDDDEVCGEIDGVCPDNCDEDIDKDCCFDDRNNFWCDLETNELDDRCVAQVTEATKDRCLTGYEEYNGDIAQVSEDLCGDDDDGVCPAGCSIYYDKDCCFATDGFWCEDVPVTGLESVCETSVSLAECNDCPTGYKGDGQSTSCSSVSTDDTTKDELKKNVHITLRLLFADDVEYKQADIYVNGHLTHVDTKSNQYERRIDTYVEADFNSIKIVPKSDFELVKLEVKLEE